MVGRIPGGRRIEVEEVTGGQEKGSRKRSDWERERGGGGNDWHNIGISNCGWRLGKVVKRRVLVVDLMAGLSYIR